MFFFLIFSLHDKFANKIGYLSVYKMMRFYYMINCKFIEYFNMHEMMCFYYLTRAHKFHICCMLCLMYEIDMLCRMKNGFFIFYFFMKAKFIV